MNPERTVSFSAAVECPPFRLDLGGGADVTFVNDISAIARHPDTTVTTGSYYVSATRRNDGGIHVAVANRAIPDPSRMDRDDAWRRRLDLAGLLTGALNGAGVESATLRHTAPLALLAASYKEALPSGSVARDVWAALARNSQDRINKEVGAHLAGNGQYDTGAYDRLGVNHAGYSHIAHFAWLYARQIATVDALLTRYPTRTLHVLDVGTGCGHFLAALAAHATATGRGHRLRLTGVDTTEDRLACAREALSGFSTITVTFVCDDVTDPTFADRLRRQHADVIVVNHVLEHLEGEVVNRYLQDWLLAARLALSISVPLGDEPTQSLSTHVTSYTAESVARLGRSMETRVGLAAETEDLDATTRGGLCTWVRPPQVADWGGFSCTTISLAPRLTSVEPHPIQADFAEPFDPAKFATARRAPCIGMIRDRDTFARIGTPRQVRQLLIKEPGGAVHLPAECAKFAEAVQIVIDHNAAANPAYADSYAYLNLFQGRTGFSSYRGLSLNCHGDQLQSLRGERPYPPDWSYIVSSTLPTMLYEQSFDVAEAVERARAGQTINLYEYLNQQAAEKHLYRSENFGIYLLSPYIVHSAAMAQDDIERVFMKVAVSTKRFFDNRELRRNPAFDLEAWYEADTVGRIDGWLSHDHWNERFLKDDVCPIGLGDVPKRWNPAPNAD